MMDSTLPSKWFGSLFKNENIITSETVNWDLVPEEFVIFDVETTGLDSYCDDILEIGALRFIKRNYLATKKLDTFQCFVKQDKPIPKNITTINSITDEMVADGLPLKEVLEKFFDFVGTRRLVAFNAEFDHDFVRDAAKKVKYKIPRPFRVTCVLEHARIRFPGQSSYKLQSLAEMLQLDTSGAHRALQDCVMTFQVYITLLHVQDRFIVQMANTQKRAEFFSKYWLYILLGIVIALMILSN